MRITIVVLCLCALAAFADEPRDGLWSASGQWPFEGSLAPRKVASPDGRAFVAGDAKGRVHVVVNGKDTLLRDLTYNPHLTEVLWSPDGRHLAITESDGGAVGTFSPYVYRVEHAGRVRRIHPERAVDIDARDLPRDCNGPETPNVVASGWLDRGRKLLLVASVPNHSVCWNMGALRGYVVRVADGRIVEKLPESRLRMAYASLLGRAYRWPTVRDQGFSFRVDVASGRIHVEAPIASTEGDAAYWLMCVGGAESFLDSLGQPSGEVFVPDRICTLNEFQGVREQSLLSEGSEPPWHTRGQFRWEELVGDCGEYPEYGRVRHFRLLGMELTLAVSDVVVRNGVLDSFRMDVSVRHRADAATRWLQPSGYLRPAGDCRTVRRGVERPMCRAMDGSWTDCERVRGPSY